jgi:predicted SprT family Zn-dependent metalloprotease
METVKAFIVKHNLTDSIAPIFNSKNTEYLESIRIDCSLSGKSRAGFWRMRDETIHLNKQLNQKDLIDTFKHELAHAVVSFNYNTSPIISQETINYSMTSEQFIKQQNKVYGRKLKPHGLEWRSVMRELNLSPDRTMALDYIQGAFSTRWNYVCDKCHKSYSYQRRSTKVTRPDASHKNCGGHFTEEKAN